ncbi:hypothetical protein [Nocardia amikacinitolerans]|uniref:hypothetical protein n=1 Tax=Nocardia amikacinitolerans TaxID=756689 RepID=UPI0020A550D6|nr:hypothetical protein [Nocardia amikacinitolerans]MCP2292506.1 hypothetical protein [Nocardia amikacinitolerans]
MRSRDEVMHRIDEVFVGSQPLTEDELAPPSIEAPYVIAHFHGRSRADIDRSSFLPSLHMEDFTYMTARAVEYYLPAVLKLMLIPPHDFELWIHLSGFLGSARRDDETTLRGLRPPQHAAIADWLELLSREIDEGIGFERKDAAKLARLYRRLANPAA